MCVIVHEMYFGTLDISGGLHMLVGGGRRQGVESSCCALLLPCIATAADGV